MFSVARLARGAERYYFSTVEGSSDLPGGLIEAAPRYVGKGAELLGLSGPVSLRHLRGLFERVHPLTGERLGYRPRSTVAYDLTFSDPKSVSLLQGLAAPEAAKALASAHEEAVTRALGFIEREVLWARKTIAGIERREETEGAVAVAFRHGVSRAGDPHLHTHLVVMSAARTRDGEWRAIDGRHLFSSQRLVRALYDSELRAGLGRLGLEFSGGRRGCFDIAGVPPVAVREFSRQTRRIEEALAKEGPLAPGEEALLKAVLRPAKDRSRSYEALRAEWQERAFAVGLSKGRLAGALSPKDRQVGGHLGPWWERARSDIDGSTSRAELLVARAEADRGGSTISQVVSDLEKARKAGLFESRGDRYFVPGALAKLRETSERLAEAATGAELRVVPYEKGGRLGALDELSRLASREEILALTPGRAYAAGFSAATGISSRPAGERGGLTQGLDWIVLPDCWALSPRELETAVAGAREAGAGVLLLARADRVGSSVLLAGLANKAIALEAQRGPALQTTPGRSSFERLESVALPSEACARAAEVARALSRSGREPVVLTPDFSMGAEVSRLTSDLPGKLQVFSGNRLPRSSPAPVVSIGPLCKAPAAVRQSAHLVLVAPRGPEHLTGREIEPVPGRRAGREQRSDRQGRVLSR